MNNEKILEIFIQENSNIAKSIFQQLKNIEENNSEETLVSVFNNLKIIKSNAHIMDFVWLERLCNGFEEIIVAIITKNLLFTGLLNNFLLDLSKQLLASIDEVKEKDAEAFDYLEKWIIDCDKIAAGIILETKNNQKSELETEEIQKEKNVVISSNRLNEMLKNFDDISIQRSRLKQQAVTLEKYEESAGIEFGRLRKNIASTINDLEKLLQQVQEQLLEAGMINLSHTFNEFQLKNDDGKCRIQIEESCLEKDSDSKLMIDKLIAPHISKILALFLENSKAYGFQNVSSPCVKVGAKKNGDLIELTFSDNGCGIDFEELRKNAISAFPQRKKEIAEMEDEILGMFLFTMGMTAEETGLHQAWKEIEKIKGKLKVNSSAGEGTTFTLTFPKSLSSETGFTIRYGGRKYFIPSQYVMESVSKTNEELVTDTPKPYFEHRDQKIKIYRLSSILPSKSAENATAKQSANTILIIEYLELKFGLVVDDLVSFSSKAVKPVPHQLKGIKEVEGIVIDENYDIIPVLHVPSLIQRFTWLRDYDLKRTEVAARKVVKNILVADSSAFARHIIRSIYESIGFHIDEANDGIEALEILKKKKISLVISAVEMPRMSGLTLLDNIQRNQEKKDIPVILFPFEAEDEVEKSYLEMGAKFVIKKSDFDRNELLEFTKTVI